MSYGHPAQIVEPFVGVVETTLNALRIIQAARHGLIPRITRRLNDGERRTMIKSGSVFVFGVEESGIKRWTDGRLWSPSRIVGNFLVYREVSERIGSRADHQRPYPTDGSIVRNVDAHRSKARTAPEHLQVVKREVIKDRGLTKKTITVTVDGTDLHLISYYTEQDLRSGKLKRPSSRPEIMALDLPPHIFRLGNLRNPPKVEEGPDGRPRIVCENTSIALSGKLTSDIRQEVDVLEEGGVSIESAPFRFGTEHDGTSEDEEKKPKHRASFHTRSMSQDAYSATDTSRSSLYTRVDDMLAGVWQAEATSLPPMSAYCEQDVLRSVSASGQYATTARSSGIQAVFHSDLLPPWNVEARHPQVNNGHDISTVTQETDVHEEKRRYQRQYGMDDKTAVDRDLTDYYGIAPCAVGVGSHEGLWRRTESEARRAGGGSHFAMPSTSSECTQRSVSEQYAYSSLWPTGDNFELASPDGGQFPSEADLPYVASVSEPVWDFRP